MATISLRFKWASFSPDPHDKTMRSNLEPCDVFVALDVPLQHEYVANAEAIIQAQLTVSTATSDVPLPVLTVDGMKFCANALSLSSKPKEEPDGEDFDWDEDDEVKEAVSSEEIHDDDNWDDDDSWEES